MANEIDIQSVRSIAKIESVFYEPEIDSTNRWAIDMAISGNAQPPSLFVTKLQTAGKGRGRKTWSAGIGSLTFSLLIGRREDPLGYTADEQSMTTLLPMALAVPLCRVIDSFAIDSDGVTQTTRIKWPNDLYLADRKLCGSLIEPVTGRPDLLVFGSGINVNNDISEHPGAVSLFEVRNRPCPLTVILIDVVDQIVTRLHNAPIDGAQTIDFCNERNWLRDRLVSWSHGDQNVKAMARNIGRDGGLILQADGREFSVYGGSISVVDREGDPP